MANRSLVAGCYGLEEEMTMKRQHEDIFGGGRTVLYFSIGDGNMKVHMLEFVERYTKRNKMLIYCK